MTTLEVTVRQNMCPDVTFTMSSQPRSPLQAYEGEVIDRWSTITGLAFNHCITTPISHEDEVYAATKVLSPLVNRSPIIFFWRQIG